MVKLKQDEITDALSRSVNDAITNLNKASPPFAHESTGIIRLRLHSVGPGITIDFSLFVWWDSQTQIVSHRETDKQINAVVNGIFAYLN